MSRALVPLLAAVLGVALAGAPALAAGPSAAPAAQPRILGPDGYKTLKLGMSEQDAVATGLLENKRPFGDTCVIYSIVRSEGTHPNRSGVIISPKFGVWSIPATSKMRTPQEIWQGSRFSDVQDAYPDLTRHPQFDYIYTAGVPGNPKAEYDFTFPDGPLVFEMGLGLKGMTSESACS
ncbi:hypothetical protein [Streptoalloteichus hindustanus]|uniref:hypothetical protein n=1 Tax=Streptoalloteichus hindustanus TaxID=2017 RepID=UPI0009379B7C|nr:hypothetical protein [Streptoalloteichus hindustanus]